MDSRNDVYDALLNTAKETSAWLQSAADDIKNVLETLLKTEYKKNYSLRKMATANLLNPDLQDYIADNEKKRLIDNLQHIHHHLTETNKDMNKIQYTLSFVRGDQVADQAIKAALDRQLQNMVDLNMTYRKTFEAEHINTMILGDYKGLASRVLSPAQSVGALNEQLKGLYKQTDSLKNQAKVVANDIEKVAKPRPGQR